MLLIVMHHYVVNSGVIQEVWSNPFATNSIFMTIWGLWGKTGINCFVMITGWFMCTSQISINKFLKLILQVEFYKIVIGLIFIISGYEAITIKTIRQFIPITAVSNGFVGAFILFYLLIPFVNTALKKLTKNQHLTLLIILLTIYTIFGSSVIVSVTFNYVSWFIVLLVLMSYIRFYGLSIKHKTWGYLTLISIFISIASVMTIQYAETMLNMELPKWHFVSDSNKILALTTALTSFMWFKDLKIKNSKLINTIAASTFGVLLIHANSNSMRNWLWVDTLQNVKAFYSNNYILHAAVSCIVIFAICILIDRLRIVFIEKPVFTWINRKWGEKFTKIEEKIFPKNV